jgi:Sigma-70 region 2
MHELTNEAYQQLLAATIRYVTKNNGTMEDARDVLHQTLLRFYDNEICYENRGRFIAFIADIVQKRWIDHLRKKGRTPFVWDYDFERNGSETIDFEQNIDYNTALNNADWSNDERAAIDALFHQPHLLQKYKGYRRWDDTECKERLERIYITGLDNKAVAQLENIQPNAFNQRLKRCRDKFIGYYKTL